MAKISRYDGRRLVITNTESDLWEILDRRKRAFATHYETAELEYPSINKIRRLSVTKHIWRLGDSLQKLSSKYYGDPAFWWVLGWFNKKPTDQHYSSGDVIDVPLPLDEIIDALGA